MYFQQVISAYAVLYIILYILSIRGPCLLKAKVSLKASSVQ